MACGWSQHHQEGLLLVSGLEEGQGPLENEVSVVICLVIVPVLLFSAINRQGVVVKLGVSNLNITKIPNA